MIKLSASAVKGFVEECYRKGFNEQQTAYLLERSLDTSDTLLYKEAGKDEGNDSDWEETTREEFFEKHPEAKEMYETPKYRKDPRYASFISAMDKGTKIYSKKGNPYLFKWDPPPNKREKKASVAQQEEEPLFPNWQPSNAETFLKNDRDAAKIARDPRTRRDPDYTSFWEALQGIRQIYQHAQQPSKFRIV